MNSSAQIIDEARTLSLSRKAQSKEKSCKNFSPLLSWEIFCEGGKIDVY